MLDELIQHISIHQDSNKFVYLIDEPLASLHPAKTNEIITSWQRKLSGMGLHTGQFIILPNQQNSLNPLNKADFSEIDQRLVNVGYDRCYRVLDSLEKNIRDIEDVVIPEVQKGVVLWKDRVHISSLVVLCFIATLAVFAEIQMGILEFLIDPIIGPIIMAILVAIMVPIHLIMSKLQAKLIIKQLKQRQKELHLMENMANLFERNLTFARMLLPISEPAGWNKKTKARLKQITEKTKELVQSLNDNFGSYNEQIPTHTKEDTPTGPKEQIHTNFLDLSKFKE